MSGPADDILRAVGDVKPDAHPGKGHNYHSPEPGGLLPERGSEDHQAPGDQKGIDTDVSLVRERSLPED